MIKENQYQRFLLQTGKDYVHSHGEPFHQLLLLPGQEQLHLALWIRKTFNQNGLLVKANGAIPNVLCLIMSMVTQIVKKSSNGCEQDNYPGTIKYRFYISSPAFTVDSSGIYLTANAKLIGR